jgi:hypothetical protein
VAAAAEDIASRFRRSLHATVFIERLNMTAKNVCCKIEFVLYACAMEESSTNAAELMRAESGAPAERAQEMSRQIFLLQTAASH